MGDRWVSRVAVEMLPGDLSHALRILSPCHDRLVPNLLKEAADAVSKRRVVGGEFFVDDVEVHCRSANQFRGGKGLRSRKVENDVMAYLADGDFRHADLIDPVVEFIDSLFDIGIRFNDPVIRVAQFDLDCFSS